MIWYIYSARKGCYSYCGLWIDTHIKRNLTQKEFAKRTGIDQANISKLDNGTKNSSLKLLKSLAYDIGMQLKIELVPMQALRK